jgi:transcriptional regulator with XRE-family HTH domain
MIRVKRFENGITSLKLGSLMGITQSRLRAWERDLERPNERQMERLMVILGLEMPINVASF